MNTVKKVVIALLIIAGITLIIAVLSVTAFPQWLLIPGGVLILLGFIASHSPFGTDINFTAWLLISMVVIVGILWPVIFVAARREERKPPRCQPNLQSQNK